ncbi:glycosyltransferase family 4 protein, partial [Patescibacteria group bacterium]|nr:glycosyltransferase family 4 protein [Patescibacteria group bacterium]
MNILMLSWRDPKHPNSGGAEIATLEHTKAWVKKGHEVFWFSSDFLGARKEETISGIKIIRKGRQYFDVQVRAFLWYFFGNHPKFDLVVDQHHGIPFFTPFYVRTKKLVFIHEVASEVWRLNPWPRPFNLLAAAIGKTLEPWIFKIFYRKVPFMVVSESTRDDLVSFGISKDNIFVIHNGVTLNLPAPIPAKEKKKTAMFLGAISEDKGIRDALLAFSEINSKDPSWQFWIVGKAALKFKNLIKDQSRQLGIVEKLKYWGYITDIEKFELLARAHVLINPSVHEGWGLVNIEANAVSTPVVGYNVHGMRDSVKSNYNGILVKQGDYRNLAENAIKLINDAKKYRRYRKNCKKWTAKFSWRKATNQSLSLIE